MNRTRKISLSREKLLHAPHQSFPFLHHDAAALGFGSVFRRRLGGRPGNVLDDLVHELARPGRAFGVAVAAELLGDFEALRSRLKKGKPGKKKKQKEKGDSNVRIGPAASSRLQTPA